MREIGKTGEFLFLVQTMALARMHSGEITEVHVEAIAMVAVDVDVERTLNAALISITPYDVAKDICKCVPRATPLPGYIALFSGVQYEQLISGEMNVEQRSTEQPKPETACPKCAQ